jgi:fused signal recognition particle receptor
MSNEEQKKGWFSRLKSGLTKTTKPLTQGIVDIFTKKKLDAATLEELEELLIVADLGVTTSMDITKSLGKDRFEKDISPEEVRTALAAQIETILDPVAQPLNIDLSNKPHVILVVGVNGSGKTTTIAKLAQQYSEEGKSVLLAAGDTFRAAAIEQLKIWGGRTGAEVIARQPGADAAAIAFDAFKQAQDNQNDVLLIDTAGRLHNKTHLMAELEKIIRTLKKINPDAPHSTLLVLDATTGQNAHSQVETFKQVTDISGLVLTKLDGSAKGGIVISLAQKFGLPIHAIGVGESADDLRPFAARDFARSLMGFED